MLSMGREIELLELSHTVLAQQMRDIACGTTDPGQIHPGTLAQVTLAFIEAGKRLTELKLKRDYFGLTR